MKNTIFSDTMTGKALTTAKAEHKRAVREALRDYAAALDGAFKRIAQSADKRARDVANAARGKYAAAAADEITELLTAGKLAGPRDARLYVSAYIVARAYPWTNAAGELMCKRTEEREGEPVRVWKVRKLTKGAADAIMSAALCNFVAGCGVPVQTIHEEGEPVE